MKILKKPEFKSRYDSCDKGCTRKYECSYCGHDCDNDCWYDK